jgi:Family of unknown function (DUF6074)
MPKPPPKRPAAIVPFPPARRRRFIVKTAVRLVSVPAKTAEKLLAATLQQQATAMARKGVPPDLIERERRKLECAIRAELWRAILAPDGIA